jgi:sulfate adenylyltransferase subunit 2
MYNHLSTLESESIYILREAVKCVPKLAMLWSFGKDSNVMIHLARKAFFGRVPFPVIHCDTELEFEEVYQFRDRYVREWNLNLISQPCPSIDKTDASLPAAARVGARKTLGLKEAMDAHQFQGIITGIRRDEEATRAKERVFSPRSDTSIWDVKNQPPELWSYYSTRVPTGGSLRIHPLLSWSERDIWSYIKREQIPIVSLYFAKKYGMFEGRNFNGEMMRFRSIGERGITWPVPSSANTIDTIINELAHTNTPERGGRPMGANEDESSFERLRQAGYM